MANTLLVGYDLKKGQDYEELIKYLKSSGTYWHNLDSTWLVVTPKSASDFADDIAGLVKSNDKVLVMSVAGDDWATFGMSTEANTWLKERV